MRGIEPRFLVVLFGLAAVVPLAAAHPHEYRNLTGEVQPICVQTGGDELNLGGVCVAAGHIVPDEDNRASISIVDDINTLAVGFYCQDLNGDGFCGGTILDDPESLPDHLFQGQRSEPLVPFCGTMDLDAPLEPGLRTTAGWSVGFNWDPTSDVFVFLRAPVAVDGVSCGILSGGSHGFLDHT